jgi:hypothetical protein
MDRLPLGALLIVWVALLGAGFHRLTRYEVTRGEVGTTSQAWPTDSRISPDLSRATLILLAHPRCPCTRASLAELERIMTRCEGRVSAHVLFLPQGRPSRDRARTDLWSTAAAIPGVCVRDVDGVEVRRFGAATSGHVLLYDQAGRLLFSGGITGARGHRGDNPGSDALIARLTGDPTGRNRTAVFGCPLFDARSRVKGGTIYCGR